MLNPGPRTTMWELCDDEFVGIELINHIHKNSRCRLKDFAKLDEERTCFVLGLAVPKNVRKSHIQTCISFLSLLCLKIIGSFDCFTLRRTNDFNL